MKRFVLLATAALVLGASGLALAQGAGATLKPADIIAARQAGFDLQGGVTAAMKTVVDGGLDVKGLAAGAKGIAAWGKLIPAMFPDGTQTGGNTKAKPEIWTDRAGFEKAAAALVAAAEKAAQLADANDKDGFKAQYAALGQACGGCHRPYRAQ